MTVPAFEEKSVRAAEQTSDSRCPSAMLRLMRNQFRLAEHPYVAAWRAGALSRSDLQIYATEHDHVVVARASLAHRVDRLATDLHNDPPGVITAESDADVERWRDFSIAAGWCHSSQWYYGADPIEQTIACVRQVVGLRRDSLGRRVARLYAIVTARVRRGCEPARGAARALLDGRLGYRVVREQSRRRRPNPALGGHDRPTGACR